MVPKIPIELMPEIEAHFDQMIGQQRTKLLAMARSRVPNYTDDDLLQPHDHPRLAAWAEFHYEDGILTGLLQAQISLRASFMR